MITHWVGEVKIKEKTYLKNTSEKNKCKYEKAQKKLKEKNYKAATSLFKEIIKENPEFVPAYNKLGVISIFYENYHQAQKWLNKALHINKKFTPALMNLGNLMKHKENTDKAIKYYEQAININPEYGPAYNNLGVIYREKGNISKSIKYMKKARKYGSLSIKANQDRPIYKEPGCIGMILIIVLFLVSIVWLLS
jgi:tetratricopeptide (TPR) repeat protein